MNESPSPPLPLGSIPGLSPSQARVLQSLGSLLEVYQTDPSSRSRNIGCLSAGIIVGLLGLVVAVFAGLSGGRDSLQGMFAGLVLAGIFLPACLWRMQQLGRGRGVQVLVFSEGLARLAEGELAVCRWDEIEAIEGLSWDYHAQGVRVGQRSIIRLKTCSGDGLRLDTAHEHLAGMPQLYERICTETTHRLLPRDVAAIEAGNTVACGPLGVSSQGIHYQDRVLAWADVEGVATSPALRIRCRGEGPFGWWRRRALVIPNEFLFLKLLEHFQAKQRPKAGPPGWP